MLHYYALLHFFLSSSSFTLFITFFDVIDLPHAETCLLLEINNADVTVVMCVCVVDLAIGDTQSNFVLTKHSQPSSQQLCVSRVSAFISQTLPNHLYSFLARHSFFHFIQVQNCFQSIWTLQE